MKPFAFARPADLAEAVRTVAAQPGAVELSSAEVAERMSGNLCRCAAYMNIVPAVQQAGGVQP